ncbi:MAG: UDP-N-acetylmuramoyl-L-alanine--D-glutamate ligase [Pontixanthobacter sp.]
MITSSAFAGKHFAILGLARSGLAAAEALLASGATVTAWDRQDVARDQLAGRAEIADPLDLDLTGFDGIVVSPGVPLNTHPISAHAAKYGVPVIGDIELFALARPELPAHKVAGITGTNGKSTTTALVHHILQSAEVPSLMGGNIGIPIMEQDPLPEGGVYVLELSSYQIDLTQSLDCEVAVLLNVTPDHLDRYESFDAYAASKARLFEMQSPEHAIVIGIADVTSNFIAGRLSSRSEQMVQIGKNPVGDQSRWPSLQGPHNAQNAAAAIATCAKLGLSKDAIEEGLRSFVGLPHRMEFVAEHHGLIFINDSKATNTDSAAPALAAYPPDPEIQGGSPRIHWIVGGLPKEDGLGACAAHLANIKTAYTIGEAGPRFAELLEGSVPVKSCELLFAAVTRAVEGADPGDVILLSPACASFDQFRDYEKRGELFRQIVSSLTGTGDAQ